MKDLPKEWQDFMYKQANEGGNKGRLDIYNKINIDDAIGDIEQMKKNLEFKNLPGKEIKRRMNAEGGVSQGLDYLAGIERREYAGGGILKTIGKKLIKKTKKPNLKRQMTREEIEDFADEYGIDPRDEYYTFDGTLADAKRILKESQDEYAYMYQQYKMGKLNPVAGEKTQDRLNFLRKKAEEAEMTSDKRLFSINEMKELEDLEKTFKINISAQ
jgi:hypothetical protein